MAMRLTEWRCTLRDSYDLHHQKSAHSILRMKTAQNFNCIVTACMTEFNLNPFLRMVQLVGSATPQQILAVIRDNCISIKCHCIPGRQRSISAKTTWKMILTGTELLITFSQSTSRCIFGPATHGLTTQGETSPCSTRTILSETPSTPHGVYLPGRSHISSIAQTHRLSIPTSLPSPVVGSPGHEDLHELSDELTILRRCTRSSTTYLQSLLHSVHQTVSQNPLRIENQCIACTNAGHILGTLLKTGVSSDVILSIARSILDWHHSTQQHIFGIRATMVYPLQGEVKYCWMVLEWRENNDTDVLAIYLIDADNEPGVYNWLVHRNKNGDATSISWTIRHIDYLKQLFEGVQHISGVLELSAADAVRLCSRSSTDTSVDAISRYIQLAYRHLRKLQHGAAQFDKMRPELERVSSRKVTQGYEGTTYLVLSAELR